MKQMEKIKAPKHGNSNPFDPHINILIELIASPPAKSIRDLNVHGLLPPTNIEHV